VASPARPAWLAVALSHLAATLWLFGPALDGSRLLYYRDLSLYYAPDYAFAASALRQGVWPLWNPMASAGEPCLFAYPIDLLLLAGLGPRAPLGAGAALHLLLALGGGSFLAHRLGLGPAGAWMAGAAYGLGGFVLSTVNLPPLFQACAWAPWVVGAALDVVRAPSARRVAVLAALLALQVSTLGAEVVLQTALVAVVLAAGHGLRRLSRVAAFAGAAALAAALAAPAIAGAAALVSGSSRGRGFALGEALAFSLHPVALAEVALPRLLGNPMGLTDAAFWGRAYFPAGHPYLLSLYLGLALLVLAARARARRRLWALAAAGVLLALGHHGPLGLLPEGLALPLRGPQKLFFLAHLSLALLAGFGLERSLDRAPGRLRGLLLLPGAALVALALACRVAPEAVRSAASALAPPILDPSGLGAARDLWPGAWLPAGALALGAGVLIARGGRWALAAGVLACVDLATVNAWVNPLAPAAFYDLRPEVAALLRPARDGVPARVFSYGVAYTPGLRLAPALAGAPSDVWLFYLDRQSLLPRTPALDGLESAFGVDRTGWAPPGSALSVAETTPALFEGHRRRLEEGNVRWVLSFSPLPAARRGEAALPEVVPPLALYELAEALPRAFWAGESLDPSPRPAAAPEGTAVVYERVDAHTVRIQARTPPGFLVVLDTHHDGWNAADTSGPVPILRAGARYRALRTPGGERAFTLRFRPSWRGTALWVALGGGLVLLALLCAGSGVRPFTAGAGTRRAILTGQERD
jgi:hypothetical protein